MYALRALRGALFAPPVGLTCFAVWFALKARPPAGFFSPIQLVGVYPLPSWPKYSSFSNLGALTALTISSEGTYAQIFVGKGLSYLLAMSYEL